MGIFDRLKKRKKATLKKLPPKEEKKEEDKREAVMTPDGRLVSAPKKETKKEKKVKPKKEETGDAYRILIKHLVTEKGSWLGSYNQYLFEVAPRANKIEVKKAIQKVYGVNPLRVNIMSVSGKQIRYGRIEGRTKDWKKAIITLPPGQKIETQEGL